MQIRQINTAVQQRVKKQINRNNNPKHNARQQANYVEKNNINKNQSFKGLGFLDGAALKIADLIENGGLLVSFTLQDMLGTNLPRPIMGLMRNSKENNGQKNLKFAAKETVREFTTGPSMFAIPGAILFAGKKIAGKTFDVPMQFIKGFGEIHADSAVNGALTKEEFFKNTFAVMLKNAKNEDTASQETMQKASEFAEKLIKSQNAKKAKKSIGTKTERVIENAIIQRPGQEIIKEFVNISKKYNNNAALTDYTKAKISDKASASFKDVVKFMENYADDVVEKVNKSGKKPNEIQEYINKTVNNKIIGRFAANMLMFASVTAFLTIVPKLYNKAEGEGNSGLKGLMKEETLNDKSLNSYNYMDFAYSQQPKVFNNMITFSSNKQINKQPSFGSAAGFAQKLTGSGIAGKFAQALEFEGYNASHTGLLGFMGLGVLAPRLIQAKDKYDREEILRRDVVTCATMAFAEKALSKGFSKMSETTSGLIVTAKGEGFANKNLATKIFDYLRPVNGIKILSSEQIVSKYSGIQNLKNGIDDFCDFIIGGNGNLSKVFSLTDESKSIVQNLLKREGKDIATADNKTIKDALSKAKDSDEVQNLINMFKSKNNPWVKKAKTLNSRFTALSTCILVPAFLGFMIPAINERATKKRIKTENEQAAQLNK